jgi:adenosine kinase
VLLAATLLAAYAIEQRGCQEHGFTRADFAARYRAAFDAELPAEALLALDVAS